MKPKKLSRLIIITYSGFHAYFLIQTSTTLFWKTMTVLEFFTVTGWAIYVLFERITEIKNEKKMILVNTDYITDKNIQTLGLVKGSTIQTRNVGHDILQSFKTLVGGELGSYTKMMDDARALATKRMVNEAEALQADGIVNIRYASSAIMQGAAEVIVYGTAVKFQ